MAENKKVYKAELRDLEPLLRNKLGADVSVVRYSTESLLPLGENYGSTILKVHALIKRNKNADGDEEELELVAKMLPPTDFQRMVFSSPITFRKEAFLYQELMPAYQRLEKELGVPDDEVFDVVAEFYGARYSIAEPDGEVDEDAVILMQNLKVQGFYVADRQKALDLEHAKAVAITLARFHALGIALKHHKPEVFDIVKERAKCPDFADEEFDPNNFFLQKIQEDPVMSEHYNLIEPAMKQDWKLVWTKSPTEPWSTIAHSDFWVNNFMFRKDDKGRVARVKFVDFQNYLFQNSLRELSFFLIMNFNPEVMENNFDEVLDYYYENFIRVLKKMRCDVTPFSRDKFDARLKIDAYEEFPHFPFMMKVMTAKIDNDAKIDDTKEIMMLEEVNEQWYEKMHRCVKKFIEKGWFREA